MPCCALTPAHPPPSRVVRAWRGRLVPFYTRLGGCLRTDHAMAGGGAALFLLRLEAPSGPATSRGAPPPDRFSAPEDLLCAAKQHGRAIDSIGKG